MPRFKSHETWKIAKTSMVVVYGKGVENIQTEGTALRVNKN